MRKISPQHKWLQTFIEDITAHLKWQDLSDVILVGHSFGGLSITGTADASPERIARLIYLDAVIPEEGKSAFDALPPDIAASRLKAASDSGGGLCLPAPRPEKFGLSGPDDLAFVASRLTPHPLATFRNPIRLNHPPGNGLPCAAIAFTDPAYLPMEPNHRRARDLGWPVFPLATGHDAMVSAPQALAALLEQISA